MFSSFRFSSGKFASTKSTICGARNRCGSPYAHVALPSLNVAACVFAVYVFNRYHQFTIRRSKRIIIIITIMRTHLNMKLIWHLAESTLPAALRCHYILLETYEVIGLELWCLHSSPSSIQRTGFVCGQRHSSGVRVGGCLCAFVRVYRPMLIFISTKITSLRFRLHK